MPSVSPQPTRSGGYFVSNYPPFSYWGADALTEVEVALHRAPSPGTPLGLYLHVPFCRRRCEFCFYKVYTGASSADVRRYVDNLGRELDLYAELPFVGERPLSFVYVGGGTPSFLSGDQIRRLSEVVQRWNWRSEAEVTFECEPGTLRRPKVEALRDIGVTRVSLGIESFDEDLLVLNGRAHGVEHIDRAYAMLRDVGFPQINIDLISGMIGQTDDNWKHGIDRTLEMRPDSVTIYQMEVPYNTLINQKMRQTGATEAPVADWATKRRWTREAFEAFADEGYVLTSGYTAVLPSPTATFRYRDMLWHGADMLGIGVSSFSHVGGVHFQNAKHIDQWSAGVEKGARPLARGFALTDEHRLIRELVLQLKLGRVQPAYFQDKFGVDILERFRLPLAELARQRLVTTSPTEVALSVEGLLQVDALLPAFFLSHHGGSIGVA